MYLKKKDYPLWSVVCYCCFVDRLGLALRLVKVADKRGWPKNGAPPLATTANYGSIPSYMLQDCFPFPGKFIFEFNCFTFWMDASLMLL